MTCHSDKPKVRVETLPNGYALTVDDKEYLYFSPLELLEGMFAHVGLNKRDYLDKQTAKDLMTAAATWPNAEDAVAQAIETKAENERLLREITATRHRNGVLQDRVDKLQTMLDEVPKAKSRKSDNITKKNFTRSDGSADTSKPVNLYEKIRFINTHNHREKPIPKDDIEYSEAIYESLMTKISDTGLTNRAKSMLKIVGGHENRTVGDAVRYTQHEFLMIRGCGKAVLEEIEGYLDEHNLMMGMDVESILFEHVKRVSLK